MNPERIIAGLDIGSAKTTVVIAEAIGDRKSTPSLRILGVGQARTTGLRKGVVSDIEETTRSIKKAVEDAERMAGTKIDTIYAGIAGEHVRAMISKGIVAVNGDEISKADVDRANDVARAQQVPQDRELLHAIPQEYSVDKNQGIRDPIGMIGTRLETEMYLVTIGASPAMNLRAKLPGRRMPYRDARRFRLELPARRENAAFGSASSNSGTDGLSASRVAAASGDARSCARSTAG